MNVPRFGQRDLFPTLQADVYLNHAAVSPPSLAVQEGVQAFMAGSAGEGVAWFDRAAAGRQRLRSALGRLLAVDPAHLALVPNTSAGVVDIALCLPWQRGDRILLFRGEFPTNVTPWQRAADRHGLELVWMDAERFRLDRRRALAELAAHLGAGIRLVAVSAVQFATGQRMPLAAFGALCAAHGAELFVDAIQWLGAMPLDAPALGIHYLSSGGHKWLMGPEGTGVLYVAPQCAAALRPEVAAWLSHESPVAFLINGAGHLRYDRPIVRAARFVEGGAYNGLGLAGLEASVALLERLGVAQIYQHVQAWIDAIEPALLARGFASARMADADGRSTILSLRPPGEASAPAWVAALAGQGVACASPDGWLRFAPHWPNALAETERVVAAVDNILAAGGPKGGFQEAPSLS